MVKDRNKRRNGSGSVVMKEKVREAVALKKANERGNNNNRMNFSNYENDMIGMKFS